MENLELPVENTPKMTVKKAIQTEKIPDAEPVAPQIQVQTKIPSHIPKYKCKNCDKLHDNPDYKKRPRFKCENCGTINAGPYCQTCTKGEEFTELSDEELEDLGIPEPSHEHEHEE